MWLEKAPPGHRPSLGAYVMAERPGRVRGGRSSTWRAKAPEASVPSQGGSDCLNRAPCKQYPKEYPAIALLNRCVLLYLYFRGQETEINLLACLWSISWLAARSGFELSMFESRIWNFHIQLFSLSLEINPTQLSCIHIFWLPVSCKAFYTDMRKILPVHRQSTC